MATASVRRSGFAGCCARLGKSAEVIVRGDIPPSYRSLPGADEIRDVEKIDNDYDAIFVIECSDLERPGIEGLENEFTVNIDHHATSEHFGTINWIDSTASAVGEMIYNLCKAIGGRVTRRDRRMRLHGARHRHRLIPFFQHNRPHLKVASELIKAGAKPAEISEAVYNNYPWSRIELMRQVLSTVKRDETGRVAWMRQTLEMRESTGQVDGDNNGFVNIPLAAREVLAAFYMREVGGKISRQPPFERRYQCRQGRRKIRRRRPSKRGGLPRRGRLGNARTRNRRLASRRRRRSAGADRLQRRL